MEHVTFGELIGLVRRERKKTVEQLAKEVEVTPDILTAWESNSFDYIPSENIYYISNSLNLDPLQVYIAYNNVLNMNDTDRENNAALEEVFGNGDIPDGELVASITVESTESMDAFLDFIKDTDAFLESVQTTLSDDLQSEEAIYRATLDEEILKSLKSEGIDLQVFLNFSAVGEAKLKSILEGDAVELSNEEMVILAKELNSDVISIQLSYGNTLRKHFNKLNSNN